MKEIQLTQGQVTIVSDEDYERASAHKWYANPRKGHGGASFYAVRSVRLPNGKRRLQYLHRFLLGLEPGDKTRRGDHINGDTLDNRRENLRIVTNRQNQQAFRRKVPGTSSKFRGVYWNKRDQKWCAQIKPDGAKQIHLGYFDVEEDAARAYDAAARAYFGEFAQPNFPLDR